MDHMQPAIRQPVGDRAPPEAQGDELPARDHPMLPGGQRGDARIRRTSRRLCIYAMQKLRHVPIRADRASPVARGW
jgi:hypothetical protein